MNRLATIPDAPERPVNHLKVSSYDRAASWVVALLVLVGIAVLVLIVLWLTNRVFLRNTAPPVEYVEELAGTENPLGAAEDMLEPGMEELQELVQPEIQDVLSAVTDVVSAQMASLDALDSFATTRAPGSGDHRQRGTGGDADIIPRWQRWEIRYESTTLEEYGRELEFFRIELGALGGGKPGIDYAFFDRGVLKKRSATADASEDRLYFIWQGGPFKEHDRRLLRQVGIDTTGRILCQFFPPDVENQLASRENEYLTGRNWNVRQVRKTIFGVRTAGRGYEFQVIEVQRRVL